MKKTYAINNSILIDIFFALIMLDVFTFSATRLEGYKDVLPIIVPYITVDNTVSLPVWMVIILGLFIFGVVKQGACLRIDLMGCFLLFRILAGIIQTAWIIVSGNENIIRWGNYFLYLMEIFIYFACLLFFDNRIIDKYINLIKIVTLIISIEIIWQSILGILPKVSYISTWYKACMNIPLGGSNVLATIISPCLIATLFDKKKFSIKKVLFMIIIGLAIVLTKSRASIIICLVAFFIYLFHNFSTLDINQRIIRLSIIILLGIIGGYFVISNLSDIGIVLYGFSDYVNEGGVINRLLSGRISLIEKYFKLIMQHPIIGNGPNYEVSRAHNIIIDILYQNGLVGFTLFSYSMYILLKRIHKIDIENSNLSYLGTYISIFLIGGLAEISFFTSRTADLLFIPAIAFASANVSKKQLEIISK